MGSKLVKWVLSVGLGIQLLLAFPLFPLAVTNFPAVQAVELSDAPMQMLAGGDWNHWHNDKKLIFIDGFISGSHWVASNSMFPASMFSDETVRAGAQILWEKTTAEFGKAIDSPKLQLPRQYTAKDMMVFIMFDSYKKTNSTNAPSSKYRRKRSSVA